MTAATHTGAATTSRRPRPLTTTRLGLPELERTAERGAGLAEHLRVTADRQLRALLVHQAQAGQVDQPEAVHQMRVATRRLRAVLRLVRSESELGEAVAHLRIELGWLAGLLGGVRDLDVLTEHLSGHATTLPEADLPAFGEVLGVLLADRSAAADRLAAALAGTRYRSLLRALATQANEAAGTNSVGFAPEELVHRPVRALRKQLTVTVASGQDADWHELRIRVKRTRYAAELARRLAEPKRAAELAELVEQAKNAQDALGEFQDTVAAEDRLRELLRTHPRELSAAAVLVLGRLVERQVARRDALRPTLPAACGPLFTRL